MEWVVHVENKIERGGEKERKEEEEGEKERKVRVFLKKLALFCVAESHSSTIRKTFFQIK